MVVLVLVLVLQLRLWWWSSLRALPSPEQRFALRHHGGLRLEEAGKCQQTVGALFAQAERAHHKLRRLAACHQPTLHREASRAPPSGAGTTTTTTTTNAAAAATTTTAAASAAATAAHPATDLARQLSQVRFQLHRRRRHRGGLVMLLLLRLLLLLVLVRLRR